MSIEALKLALEALEGFEPKTFIGSDAELLCRAAITAIREALAEQPAPPPECQTEAEKTAFAFGWFKALEQKRKDEQPAQQQKEGFASPGGGYVPAIPRPMPPDWKLVPRKATPEMLKAMDECAQEGYDERLYAGMASSVYMAAWDASPVMGTLPEQPAQQEPVAWLHTKIEGVAVPHRPADLDKHPDRWTALYPEPKPCPTCEALARTVMMDQTAHDKQRKPLTDEQIMEMYNEPRSDAEMIAFARAIEAAHGIKEQT